MLSIGCERVIRRASRNAAPSTPLALLARRLTPEEVAQVADAHDTGRGSQVTLSDDVRRAIQEVPDSPGLEEDVERIAAYLREPGGNLERSGRG